MSSASSGWPRVSWDAVGIGASTLCAIHCALVPFVLAFSPTLAHSSREMKSFIALLQATRRGRPSRVPSWI